MWVDNIKDLASVSRDIGVQGNLASLTGCGKGIREVKGSRGTPKQAYTEV